MAKPETTIRIGRCTASVFVNTTDDKDKEQQTFRSVALQRSYRDGERWKTSTSFSLADLPDAIAALQIALHFVAEREATGSKQTTAAQAV